MVASEPRAPCPEKRTSPASSAVAGTNGSTGGHGLPSVLPAFVTPDWLRENHHLMKADLRKLAGAVKEDYADWPANVDGSDEAAFWRAVHTLAERWTWFLRLFEDRILTQFGKVKGLKKQLAPRVLKQASQRAKALKSGSADAEPTVLEHLETLWEEGEHVLVAQSVWVLSCLEGPEGRYLVSSWLDELEIESLIGDAVRRARLRWNPERDDLVERLTHGTSGPHLERPAARANEACAALRKDIADSYARLKTLVAEQDEYDQVADVLSFLVLDLGALADELEEVEAARDDGLARSRHAALRALLDEALVAIGRTSFAGGEAALFQESALPQHLPDREWERCRGQAERFRRAIVEPGRHELSLREASRRYAENPGRENLEALHAAAEAERDHPRSLEPANAALDDIAACLGDLVQVFGSMAERSVAGEDTEAAGVEAGGKARDREDALRAEIGDLKAANRSAEEKIASLEQALGDAGEENAGLRRQKHGLQQRLAALDSAGEPTPADELTVPPLESYADLPAWTERHFGGRVALAGRASRALRSAGFEDVDLVGKSIALLGGPYWHMKTTGGKALRDAFEDELRELRLQETHSLRRDRQGKARDDFSIEWEGRRLTLDRHLKNNAGTRDPRRCLRVYFTWDEDSRRVVIGYLPGHMRT